MNGRRKSVNPMPQSRSGWRTTCKSRKRSWQSWSMFLGKIFWKYVYWFLSNDYLLSNSIFSFRCFLWAEFLMYGMHVPYVYFWEYVITVLGRAPQQSTKISGCWLLMPIFYNKHPYTFVNQLAVVECLILLCTFQFCWCVSAARNIAEVSHCKQTQK